MEVQLLQCPGRFPTLVGLPPAHHATLCACWHSTAPSGHSQGPDGPAGSYLPVQLWWQQG
jgi:hypothetical protein